MGCPTENHHWNGWCQGLPSVLRHPNFRLVDYGDKLWCIIIASSMCWNMFMDVYGSIPIFHWTSKKYFMLGPRKNYIPTNCSSPRFIVHLSPLFEISTLGFLDFYGTSYRKPRFFQTKKTWFSHGFHHKIWGVLWFSHLPSRPTSRPRPRNAAALSGALRSAPGGSANFFGAIHMGNPCEIPWLGIKKCLEQLQSWYKKYIYVGYKKKGIWLQNDDIWFKLI